MFKLAILGDLHLRHKTPEGRTDDNFLDTQIRKLDFVFYTAKDKGCDLVVQPGDFFDRHNPASSTKIAIASLLKKYNIPLICVAGQHDMVGHSLQSIQQGELKFLEVSGLLKIATSEPIYCANTNHSLVLSIYGASYGQEIPELKPNESEYTSILLIHKQIGRNKLFPTHKLMNPVEFARNNNNYDLIVCGDYHYPFSEQLENGNIICNAGALVRLTRKEQDINHQPLMYIYDAESRNIEETIKIPIQSKNTVFKEKGDSSFIDKDLLNFVQSLKSGKNIRISFEDNLDKFLGEQELNPDVVGKIFETQNNLKEIYK